MARAAYPNEKATQKELQEQTFDPMGVIAISEKQKFCEAHGEFSHSSNECKVMIRLKSRGWIKRNKKLQEIKKTAEENSNNNKSFEYSFVSSFPSKREHKNPFIIKSEIFKKRVSTLIDTGADLTILNKRVLPSGIRLDKAKKKLVFVTNTPLNVIGELKNIEMRVLGRKFRINVVIIDQGKSNTDLIIRVGTIRNFPSIVEEVLNGIKEKISSPKLEMAKT